MCSNKSQFLFLGPCIFINARVKMVMPPTSAPILFMRFQVQVQPKVRSVVKNILLAKEVEVMRIPFPTLLSYAPR